MITSVNSNYYQDVIVLLSQKLVVHRNLCIIGFYSYVCPITLLSNVFNDLKVSRCFVVQAKMAGVDLSAREYYIPGASGSYLNYGAAASEVSLLLSLL